MGNVKEIFKKLIKRKIFMAVLLLFLIVVFVAVKKMPKGSEPAAVKEFSMKNDMLAGNQDGVVSIVNIASRKQLFSLNLNKIYEKDYEPAELNIIKSSPPFQAYFDGVSGCIEFAVFKLNPSRP
jgi:hypothetical protein